MLYNYSLCFRTRTLYFHTTMSNQSQTRDRRDLCGSIDADGDVLVRLARELGLDLERAGSVVSGHDELDELDLVSLGELGVVEEVAELGLGGDCVRLAGLALDTAEGGQEAGPVPTESNKHKWNAQPRYEVR